jgi:hypothetical protein
MTTLPALVLSQAENRLLERAQTLAAQLDSGNDSVFDQYVTVIVALKTLLGDARTPMLTTQGLADRLQLSPRTIRRLHKAKKLTGVAEKIQLGKAGRGSTRWRSTGA